LNTNIIINNPKFIIGYSDTTTLLSYINQLGLVTLHGPSVIAGLSQWKSLGNDYQEHIRTLLFDNPSEYAYRPFSEYSNGYPDWNNVENVGKVKTKVPSTEWNWLQGDGVVRGKLFGGNIEVLEFLKGTRFWPDENFWDGRILFLETSEDRPKPEQVKWMLRNYGMQGVFDKIAGLLIGRARDYSDEEKRELNDVVLQVVGGEFGNTTIPIVTNLDFGHTDPQWILPLGIEVEIKTWQKSFKLVENIFEE
jgi:muramoyltetrapeptide carboxypeptidase LdcA involved in peptidoglycan recycling